MKNIKKSLMVCVAALTMGSMTGCDFFTQKPKEEEQQQEEQQVVQVESIALNTTALDLTVGEKQTLTVTVLPENATDKSVVFKSSKNAVATVSLGGEITAVAKGTAIITVQSASNPGKFQTCLVSVEDAVPQHIDVESLEVGVSQISLEVGQTQQIQATVSPSTATDKSLTWSSSNLDAATVDQQGNVEALAIGTSIITVQSNDKPTLFKNVTVEVVAHTEPVTGVDITDTSRSIQENGEAILLTCNVAPTNASNQSIIWSSSNEGIATVSATGLVTPHLKGTAVIRATSAENSSIYDECTIYVERTDVTSFTLNRKEYAFVSNATGDDAKLQLIADIEPDDATYQEVEWSSSDETVATVSNDGLVTMQGVGSAVITALHVQSHLTATCLITVVEPNSLKVNLPIATSQSYQTYIANSATKPEEAKDSEFVYSGTSKETYEVGDDNPFSFRPSFTVKDLNDNPVDESAWVVPFSFEVKKLDKVSNNFVTAPTSDYQVTNAISCEIKFADTAIDDTYKVSVVLGGFTESQMAAINSDPAAKAAITAEYTVKVVDGYNATNEFEFSYLDTRTTAGSQSGHGGEPSFTIDYPAFKTAHKLQNGYFPKTLVLHKDLSLTAEHFPAVHFYTSKDADDGAWAADERQRSVGSLKDYAYIVQKWTEDKTVLSGNYFTIDFSRIPLVKRTNGLSTGEMTKVESHSKLFRTHKGEFEMKNLNIIGNAGAARTQAETYLAGGLIGFDVLEWSVSLTARNILSHNCYVTFMNDGNWAKTESGENLLYVTDCKLSDNYNCFIYNYGGHVISTRTKFEGCGGPVIIQDQIIPDPQYPTGQFDSIDADHGQFILYGHVSTAEFNDCDIRNYVIGTEAWFMSFGAAAMVEGIKNLSDALTQAHTNYLTEQMTPGNPIGFLFDENHHGTTYYESGLAGKDCMMNMIVINKSDQAENATSSPVNGKVFFRDKDGNPTDSFTYMNPTSMTENTPEELQRFTDECTLYLKFRGVNNGGAPVYETSGGHACFAVDPDNGIPAGLYSMEAMAQSSIAPAPAGVYSHTGHIALYYTGMMIVFGAANRGV